MRKRLPTLGRVGRPVEVTAIAVLASIAGFLGLFATFAFVAIGDEIPPATTLGDWRGLRG